VYTITINHTNHFPNRFVLEYPLICSPLYEITVIPKDYTIPFIMTSMFLSIDFKKNISDI